MRSLLVAVILFQCSLVSGQHWTNHDGLSRLDHARLKHGINTYGMSEQQASRAADADHNRRRSGAHLFSSGRSYNTHQHTHTYRHTYPQQVTAVYSYPRQYLYHYTPVLVPTRSYSQQYWYYPQSYYPQQYFYYR